MAHLYKKLGKSTQRKASLEAALTEYEKFGWKLKNIDEIEAALPLIEAKKTLEAVKKYGESIKPDCRQSV